MEPGGVEKARNRRKNEEKLYIDGKMGGNGKIGKIVFLSFYAVFFLYYSFLIQIEWHPGGRWEWSMSYILV